MEQKQFLIGEALKKGWIGFKENMLFFFLFFLSAALIGGGIAYAASLLQITEPYISNVLSIVFQTVFSTILGMALYRISLQIVDGKKPTWHNVFEDFNKFFNYYFGSLFYGICVGIGLLLLIVPGVYLSLKWLFWPLNVVDKGMGPIESLKESSKQTEGIKWDLLGLFIVTILINVLGVLCLLIGMFVALPVTMIAWAHIYRKITEPSYS